MNNVGGVEHLAICYFSRSVNLRIFRLRPNVPAASFTQAGASAPPEILLRTHTH